ncbi:MAG: hypothetical protein QOI61_1402 [Actinomycetota bacterium]|jgi:hypothetical protein
MVAAGLAWWRYHDLYYTRVSRFWGMKNRLVENRAMRAVSLYGGAIFLVAAGAAVAVGSLANIIR